MNTISSFYGKSASPSDPRRLLHPDQPWESARRVTAICCTPEAGRVKAILQERIADAERADLLWLTWVEWRAMGREAMVRETGLTLWTVTSRLRQLREAGIVIPTWTQEQDMLARGRFFTALEAPVD